MSEANDQRWDVYASRYRARYAFEAVLVLLRQEILLEVVQRYKPDVVVEVGCGDELLVEACCRASLTFGRWVVVEPNPHFAGRAHAAAVQHDRLKVVDGRVEDVVEEVIMACGGRPDAVVCSGVLHEVPDPNLVLAAAATLLPVGGLLHVNVPNAGSIHRWLARCMGLIAQENELTERDFAFGHSRVFDLAELTETLRTANFKPVDTGGYFIKPFTHEQMESLDFVTTAMIDGLYALGRELPELAAEIYVNAFHGASA